MKKHIVIVLHTASSVAASLAGEPDGHGYTAGTNRLRRSYFRKLNLLLYLSHFK